MFDHFDRLTIDAIGKNYNELHTLFLLSLALPRTDLAIDSTIDFQGKMSLLVDTVVALVAARKEGSQAPTSKTAYLLGRIERYIPLAVRMLQRATARLELAHENPDLKMKRVKRRRYELPKSIGNSGILRDD